MKVIKWLDDHFEEFLLVIFLVLITCVSLIQVIIRKIPWIPSLQWAEEFCRFCWIASVFISLPYTIRKGTMLRVNVLMDLFPHIIRKSINIIVDFITTACMALLAYSSVSVVGKIMVSNETSPAMLWPMWMVYAFMLLGFSLGTLRGIQQIIIKIQKFNVKELTTLEQTMAEAAEEAAMAKGEEGGVV